MSKILKRSLFFLFLSLCILQNNTSAQEHAGHIGLEQAISYYKDGEYQKTVDRIQEILPVLTEDKDKIMAYKYLGFSYSMLSMIDKSKSVFATLLEKYPSVEIDTLEMPPNIFIIYKQAKLEKKIEMLDTLGLKNITITPREKKVTVPIVLLSTSIISAGAGAYLFYLGYQHYQDYKSVDVPDQTVLDRYYSGYRNASLAGAACAVGTAVLFPFSLYLFFKKEPSNTNASISFVNGSPLFVLAF